MKRYFNLCYLFVMVCLSACSVEPNYQPAPINIPANWINNKQIMINEQIHLPEVAWWESYHDPQLNNYIELALKNNNDINIAVSNLEYAQGELKQVKLNWIPGMNLLVGTSQMPYLGDPGNFWGLFPLYTLNVFKQIKQQESAEHQVEVGKYAKDAVRLTVIGQVSGSYFTLLSQTRALAYFEDLLENNQKLLKLYQSQYENGLVAQDKIDIQLSTIQQIESQIVVTKHNIIVSKNALRYLLNQNPGDIFLKNSFDQIDSNAVIPGNLPATVLHNRPDIQEAKAKLGAANAEIGVAVSHLLPSVRLDVFAGEASNMSGFVDLNEAYVNIPVIAPSVLGKIDMSQAQYKAYYIAYIDSIRKALRDVNNDLSGYSAYSQQLKNNELAWKNENHQCHLVDSRYKQGIDNQVDVKKCQIKLNEFSLMLNQNKLEKMMTIVALYQDLGGGYKHGL